MRIKKTILTAAGTALVLTAVYGMYLRGFFLPSWVKWNRCQVKGDFDLDGTEDILRTEKKKVYSERNGELISLLPGEWLVSDLHAADIDHDGRQEILLIVFNRDTYGKYHPFWEKEYRKGFCQHLYIYHYENDSLVPFWMSSALKPELSWVEVREDGTIMAEDTQGEPSEWQWKTWGIERTDK